jgi:hypothetical protein
MSSAFRYLQFDDSDTDEGAVTFEAMASARGATALAALHEELAQVLRWLHERFGAERGPLDEGGRWDWTLSAQEERSRELPIGFDPASGRVSTGTPVGPEAVRHTVTLSVAADPAVADAFRRRFAASLRAHDD